MYLKGRLEHLPEHMLRTVYLKTGSEPFASLDCLTKGMFRIVYLKTISEHFYLTLCLEPDVLIDMFIYIYAIFL